MRVVVKVRVVAGRKSAAERRRRREEDMLVVVVLVVVIRYGVLVKRGAVWLGVVCSQAFGQREAMQL